MKTRQALLPALLWAVMASLPASAAPASAAPPAAEQYRSTPYWLQGGSVPQVMLVLERDWKMFYPAYNNLTDLDNDGRIDIGFNPGVTYVGYFDVDSCYYYDAGGEGRFVREGAARPQNASQLAARIPQAIKDISKDTDGDGLMDRGIKTPLSKHGVCEPGRAAIDGGAPRKSGGLWHGNWLNFATTSRMDAIRRVLYGGTRSVDTPRETVLELVPFLPSNAHVWGGELFADADWEKYAKTSPWYDIPSFTGYTRPLKGTVHFWARTSHKSYRPPHRGPATTSFAKLPLFQVAAHVPLSNWNKQYKTPVRIWDWIGDHGGGYMPTDANITAGPTVRGVNVDDKGKTLDPDRTAGAADPNGPTRNGRDPNYFATNAYGSYKPAQQAARHFTARVLACQAGNLSPTEGCRDYGGSRKPVGLLQEYGETNKMLFGLLTGSIYYPKPYNWKKDTRWRGGVVRHHIQNFGNYVNAATGQIKRPGLIDTIDRLRVTGVRYSNATDYNAEDMTSSAYIDGTQAGNPLGTMVYEAMRYMVHRRPTKDNERQTGLDPTSEYQPGSEIKLPQAEGSNILDSSKETALPRLTEWDTPPASDPDKQDPPARPYLSGDGLDCSKPVILVLSEVYPDHDADYSGSVIPPSTNSFHNSFPNLADLDRVPRLKAITKTTPPERLNIAGYLDVITKHEELVSSNKKYFLTEQSRRRICKPRAMPSSGLAQLNGHCPSEPSLQGSYSLAAVAYYAHTHDLTNLNGVDNAEAEERPDGVEAEERPADLYAVGIPGNFPDIELNIDDDHKLTLMPVTMANDDDGSKSDPLRTLINFYMERWETDDGGRPIKLKFATNFEYTTTPAYSPRSGSNNMERDIFNQFEISVLTDGNTPKEYRERMPVFINSGMLKTCPYVDAGSVNDSAEVDRDPCMQRWYANKAAYLAGNAQAFENEPNPEWKRRYYYAFKNPNPKTVSTPLDIKKQGHTIVGVAIQNNVHGSYINMFGSGGYTISGSTRDGVYLDAGYGGGTIGLEKYYSTRDDSSVYYTGADASITPNNSGTAFNDQQVVLTADYPDPTQEGSARCYRVRYHEDIDIESSYKYYKYGKACRGLPPDHVNQDYPPDEFMTPWECPFAGYTDGDAPAVADAYGNLPRGYAARACGKGAADTSTGPDGWFPDHSLMRYIQVRGFKFDEGAKPAERLKSPLWLAAKYGGFKDHGGGDKEKANNGLPDPGEWERDAADPNSDPHNYYEVANLSQLSAQLGLAFEDIANSVASGTANAASINTVLGGGLSIQTQFYTKYVDKSTPPKEIRWLGSVYALFADKWGNLRADTNQDNQLQLKTSSVGSAEEEGDLIVHTVTPPGSRGLPTVYLCRDPNGNNNGTYKHLPSSKHPPYPDFPDAGCVEQASMDAVKPVWHAGQRLAEQNPDDRELYTYYGDAPGDGKGTWDDQLVTKYPFEADKADKLRSLMRQPNTEAGLDETRDLINYVRGHDFGKYRSRTAKLPWDKGGAPKVWPLGDVINSRPIIVGEPAGNFHLTYRDQSYAAYKKAQARRRQVVYFGSNDGILHAVNLGFFGSFKTGAPGYSRVLDDPKATTGPELGAELWGYVPAAVLPHLAWLADPEYEHNYFVDLKPHIVDMKDKNGNWRTVMIVGLRLGGRTIALEGDKISYAEFFALDITDPEAKPALLWRYTGANLGLTSAQPQVVRQGEKWYAVLPSGPTSDLGDGRPDPVNGPLAYEGRSTQAARLIVLDALTGEYARGRDRSGGYATSRDPLMVPEASSFFNGAYLPRTRRINRDSARKTVSWDNQVLYLSLTARDDNGRDTGAVYRLQMDGADGQPLPVDKWKLARFYQADKPVTGDVNSTYDSLGNLWVVFGSGRIWSKQDQMPCGRDPNKVDDDCCDNHEQYLYGLKEPLDAKGNLTFAEVGLAGDQPIVDVSGVAVWAPPSGGSGDGVLEPAVDAGGGEPISGYDSFYQRMIAKDNTGDPLVRGYKRKLEGWRTITGVDPGPTRFELVSTQPQIDGLGNGRSNTVFTSYLTSDNLCDPLGESYLNVVDTYTGLPHPSFLEYSGLVANWDENKQMHQVVGNISAGVGPSSGATITKTGESTGYNTTGFNGQNYTINPPPSQADRSGVIIWREVLDMGLTPAKTLTKGKILFEDLTAPAP